MNTKGLNLFDEYDQSSHGGLHKYLSGKFGREFKVSTLLKVETSLKSKKKNNIIPNPEASETGLEMAGNRVDPGTDFIRKKNSSL